MSETRAALVFSYVAGLPWYTVDPEDSDLGNLTLLSSNVLLCQVSFERSKQSIAAIWPRTRCSLIAWLELTRYGHIGHFYFADLHSPGESLELGNASWAVTSGEKLKLLNGPILDAISNGDRGSLKCS